MFSNRNRDVVVQYATHRIKRELRERGTGARITKATGIKSSVISRWKTGKKGLGEVSVRRLVQDYWREDESAFVAAARRWAGVATVTPVRPPAAKRRSGSARLPRFLAEAIRLRAERWSLDTVTSLQRFAADTGLRLSVGAWLDCGDEMEALARAAVHPNARPQGGGLSRE